MTKKLQIKAYISAGSISLIMLVMGVLNLITAFSSKDFNFFSLIVGIIITLFAFYPIISAIRTNKNGIERAVKDMNVENSSLVLGYEFKEKRAEISLTQDGVTKFDTLMYKNVSKARVTSEGIAIYLNGNDMYYIENADFKSGNKSQLISLLKRNNIEVK